MPDLNDTDSRGRHLKSATTQETTIYRLDEPYPTQCYNHGQLAKQTQRYYMCRSTAPANGEGKPSEPFRVD